MHKVRSSAKDRFGGAGFGNTDLSEGMHQSISQHDDRRVAEMAKCPSCEKYIARYESTWPRRIWEFCRNCGHYRLLTGKEAEAFDKRRDVGQDQRSGTGGE